MKEIGGFFELELNKTEQYHERAIKLNLGRNCLRYILKCKNPTKIHIPYYSCDSILDVITKENIDYEFYNIDENLDPKLNKEINDEYILYINYFGLKTSASKSLKNKFSNLILDNSQAFFIEPFNSVDTFYSPRKFFGVPDGGYLYTNSKLPEKIEKDSSYRRCEHLLRRLDDTASSAYKIFKENEEKLNSQPIKKMSDLTESILSSIDYQKSKLIRNNNFLYLHNYLKDYNEFNLNIENLNGPMVYPFLFKDDTLKKFLIDNKIYVATYWDEVLSKPDDCKIGKTLTKYLCPLPIDQRYSEKDMERILEKINEYL